VKKNIKKLLNYFQIEKTIAVKIPFVFIWVSGGYVFEKIVKLRVVKNILNRHWDTTKIYIK